MAYRTDQTSGTEWARQEQTEDTKGGIKIQEDAIKAYNSGKMSLKELQAIATEGGKTLKFWDTKTEQHPDSIGNNRSRFGFMWNPSNNPRGIFFQAVTKKITLIAIDIAYAAFFAKNKVIKWMAQHTLAFTISAIHAALIHNYDKDIFVYDDDRINMINDFADVYIKENFQHAYPYKHDFMMQVKDIMCGMLAKEDEYYRARFFDAFNKFIVTYPHEIPLHESEKENIAKWH